MKKNNRGIILFGCALAFALVFNACDMESRTQTTNAAVPIIVEAPVGGEYAISAQFDLVVEASAPDGGELTYQWYYYNSEDITSEEGTLIRDATDYTYSSITGWSEEGVYYYYALVSNYKDVNGNKTAEVRSPVAVITINNGDIRFPIITEQPANRKEIAGEIALSARARLSDLNQNDPTEIDPTYTLTYQWFFSNTYTNRNGSPATGLLPSGDTVQGLSEGIWYAYVVATNTSTNGKPYTDQNNQRVVYGSKSVASIPAKIEVIAEMNPNATITLNPSRKYQYVRGFGGMDIPWGNFYSITMEEYEKMYNPTTGLGLNMMRIMIMPENPEDNTDPEATIDYYLGEGGRPNYIEGAKLVNGYKGYLLASPWSPPPEWKTNSNKNGGGSLIASYYPQYANYLKTYAQVMYDRGAPIYAISIQNEPNFLATYDGCEWSDDEMRNFFVSNGTFTNGVPGWGGGKAITRVLRMNGESANHPNINDSALNNATSAANIDVIGRHIYGNVQVNYTKAKELGKEVWMTEHNINSGNEVNWPNDSTWNYVWEFMNDIDVSIRLNEENAFIWWALKRFYSFIGDGDPRGRTVEGAILPRGYAISHYAKYASEKWRCGVAVTGTLGDGRTAVSTENVNNTNFDRNSTAAKVTSFVSDDGNEIGVVIYTPTNTSGGSGTDLGTVKIQMPNSFKIATASAIRSTAAVKAKAEEVMLNNDRYSAFVMVPPGQIVSVKFTKAQE